MFSWAEGHLVDYGHRYYSPSLGRFFNRGPIEEQGGINLYSFVGNNLVNQWDYWGMVELLLHVMFDPDDEAYGSSQVDIAGMQRGSDDMVSNYATQSAFGASVAKHDLQVELDNAVADIKAQVANGQLTEPQALAQIRPACQSEAENYNPEAAIPEREKDLILNGARKRYQIGNWP